MMEAPYQWFAMRATYKREFIAQDYLLGKGIEVFLPLKKEIKVIKGRKRKISVPAINSLIFVKAQKEVLQQAKMGVEYLQYLTRKEEGRNVPIVVPERQMEQFIQVVMDDTIDKTYFSPDEVNLKIGSKVKVHGGAFDGLEGVLVKIKGKRKKQFFINVDGIVAVNTIIENVDLLEVVD